MSSHHTPAKDLATLGTNEHVALTGKPGTLIWVGRKRFELDNKIKVLFTPDELLETDKIVITGDHEAWLLRECDLYRIRLYNIPTVHFSAGNRIHPFQRCIWNGLFRQCEPIQIEQATHGLMENVHPQVIQALIRTCEILPSCEDGSEWRELTGWKPKQPDSRSNADKKTGHLHETHTPAVRNSKRKLAERHTEG